MAAAWRDRCRRAAAPRTTGALASDEVRLYRASLTSYVPDGSENYLIRQRLASWHDHSVTTHGIDSMLPSISSLGAPFAAARQAGLPPLRERVLRLARQAGIEPDERQLSTLADTAAWTAYVWRNIDPRWRGTLDSVRLNNSLSLAQEPQTWPATRSVTAMMSLLGVAPRASYDDSLQQLARGIESVVQRNPDETWAELERRQHPVTRIDPHSAVRDLPPSVLRVALQMGDLDGADLSVEAAQNPDLLVDLDLSGRYLEKVNLSGMNLGTVRLRGANLVHANLAATKLRGADLCRTNLMHANLRDADLDGAVIDDVHLMNSDFSGAVMHGVRLSLRPDLLAMLAKAPPIALREILQSIDTISDDYRELKRDVMRSVVDAFAYSPDSNAARINALIVRDFMADRSSIYGDSEAR
jgi:hypothetical protein